MKIGKMDHTRCIHIKKYVNVNRACKKLIWCTFMMTAAVTLFTKCPIQLFVSLKYFSYFFWFLDTSNYNFERNWVVNPQFEFSGHHNSIACTLNWMLLMFKILSIIGSGDLLTILIVSNFIHIFKMGHSQPLFFIFTFSIKLKINKCSI